MTDLKNVEQNVLFNFVQGSEVSGQSTYDIWLGMGYTGSKEDFLEFIRTGSKGDPGLSAYHEWLTKTGNAGKSFEEYMLSLRGKDGLSAYDVWKSISGNENKTKDEFVKAIKGDAGIQGPKGDTGVSGSNGVNGKSAYQIWLDAGNTGTEDQFIASLKGEKGDKGSQGIQGIQGPKGDKGDQGTQGPQGPQGEKGTTGPKGDTGATGKSAYQIWLDAGNTGTEVNFLASLKGPKGDQGPKGTTGAAGKSWEEGDPLDFILMRDTTTGLIYKVFVNNGELVCERDYTPEEFAEVLKDFTYEYDADNGTYELMRWKGTLNGKPSTEIVVPNSSKIII